MELRNKEYIMAKKTNKTNVIDGKIEEIKEEGVKVIENITGGKRNVRSIDELLGRKTTFYTAGTLAEYDAKVRDMTLADLQHHATSVGLLPISNKNVLINRLLNEYKKKSRGYFNTAQFNTVEPKNKEATIRAIRKAGGE